MNKEPITEEQVMKLINEYFNRNYYSASPKIPPHQHNGVDNLQIDPQTLLGFPIQSTVPTDNAQNGIIRLYYDGTNYRLYARINNQWKGVALS